jgi:homopolymeric O-antigen transport system ATP-binding protein
MRKPIIEVSQLSKRYRLGSIGASSLRYDLQRWMERFRPRKYAAPIDDLKRKKQSGWIWALKDVTFTVAQGEALGFVGSNGAGKTTLLKLLSRITEPTRGEAVLRGQVASLLEVGTGMHLDLTGRENIFLNAAILGMRKEATKRKLDDIIDFSGVRQFIDTPVKRYSSGMRVRLGFAVAAFLEADILIADEVLAVGDAEFQKKCIGKMSEVAKAGRTVLFVSHDLAAVQNLCTRVIAIRKGEIIADSTPAEAIHTYLNRTAEERQLELAADTEGPAVVSASVSQGPNTLEGVLTAGKPAYFSFQLRSMVPGAFLVLEIYNQNSLLISRFGSERADFGIMEGDLSIACVMDPLRLAPGRYRLAVSLYVHGIHAQRIENLAEFEVSAGWVEGDKFDSQRWGGMVKLAHQWQMVEESTDSLQLQSDLHY